MKKRLISLALTLALCLGLAVPALAADTSGLDANGAKAYLEVLNKQIAAYGIITDTDASGPMDDGVHGVELVDMDSNGTPELIIVACDSGNTLCVNVWTLRGGSAAQVVTMVANAPSGWLSGEVYLAVKGKETGLVSLVGGPNISTSYSIYKVDGSVESKEGSVDWVLKEDSMFFSGEGTCWYNEGGSSISAVQSALTAKAASAPSGGFTDVNPSDYYADAVKWAVDRKITSGTSATTFSPKKTCSVAEILTFLWNANGKPEPTGRNPFSDISTGDYFYKAAVWAAGKGLVSGNKLNPSTPCTRAMVMEYLWKLAGSPAVSSNDRQYAALSIRDIDPSESEITLLFEAAIQKQAPVKICRDTWDDVGEPVYHTGVTEQEYQLIIVRPGSKITVSGGRSEEQLGSNVILAESLPVDSDGVFHPQPSESPSSMSTGNLSEEAYLIKGSKQTYLVVTNDSIHEKVLANMIDAAGFTDVPSSAAYAQAVTWAVKNGITAGTSDTTFSPNNTCTRGEIVTFLHRAMG